jgi:hypothetical protein
MADYPNDLFFLDDNLYKDKGDDMFAMTPIKKIVRIGREIYTVDYADKDNLVAKSPTRDDASWVASSLAGWHQVPLEERDVDGE